MGPSGSGKSTLLHCLAGILTPDAGEVCFDGRRVDTGSTRRRRSALRRDRFGFVFQFGQLVPELTAEENVALPLLLGGASPATRSRRGPRRGSSGSAWTGWSSAGRASCPAARPSGSRWPAAWSPRPEVLFADEPTGSLDSLTGEQVMDLLVAAAREQGTTVVLVTHEPRVAAYADREVVVRDGRVTSLLAGSRGRMIRLGAAAGPARRAGGRRPARRHRRGRGARRRPAADHPGRHQRRQRPERPLRLARTPAPSCEAHAPAATRTRCGGGCGPTTFHGKLIGRVDVAATGPHSPVPPGIPHLPGPGQYYASPALGALLRSTPADQLGDRYPRHGRSAPSAPPRCRRRTR